MLPRDINRRGVEGRRPRRPGATERQPHRLADDVVDREPLDITYVTSPPSDTQVMTMVAGPVPDCRVHVRLNGNPCARELARADGDT